MIKLSIPSDRAKPLTILCLGAHSDDIEIGCGATLLHLKQATNLLKIHWIVFSAAGARAKEARVAADLFTKDCEAKVVLGEFEDGFLPYSGGEVKRTFESLKTEVNPSIIFTHWREDAHQDHRLLSELTWNTFRDHLIMEYEIPKYDGDLGKPNVYVPLDAPLYERKIDYLFQAFRSQQGKRWFDRNTFLGLMRIRGMECNAVSGYAESFHCRKMVL